MNQDPSTNRAKQRSRLGLVREVQQTRTGNETKPTSGSKGVPKHRREEVVQHAIDYSVNSAHLRYGHITDATQDRKSVASVI